jgi:hypothetical protein
MLFKSLSTFNVPNLDNGNESHGNLFRSSKVERREQQREASIKLLCSDAEFRRRAKANVSQPPLVAHTAASQLRPTAIAYQTTKHLTTLSTHTRRTHQPPCLFFAHLASSAPRADSSRSSPASPRPHYSSSARSLLRLRARAATHTATHTTRLPDGSSASSLVRRRRRRAGRTSSTTASLAPLLSALLATGSSRTPGRL